MTPTNSAERRAVRSNDPAGISAGKLVAWSSSHAAQAANVLFLGYFTIYCTDTLGLSPSVVGVLLLASRIADGVGALVAGWLVDIAPETRFGKARPFDLAIAGVWILTVFMFSTPIALGEVGRYVWAFTTYLFVTAVFTPLFLANQPLYMARSFDNREAYAKLSARSGAVIGVVALATAVSVPILIGQAGKSPAGWSILALGVAVPLTLFGLLRFFTIKEQSAVGPVHETRVRIKDIATVLRTNPYIWLLAVIQLIGAIVGNVGVGAYYFRYIVGNISLMGTLGILNVLGLPVLFALPSLIRRFSISRLIAIAGVISAIGYVIYGVAGANVPVLVVGALFTSIGSLPASFLLTVLIIDNATFNEWKGNRRLESVGGGIASFAMSAGSGIAAAVSGLLLGAAGYNGTAAQQPHPAIVAMVALMGWIPAALSLLTVTVALVYFHRFERRLPTINREVEERRAALLVAVAGPANEG